MNIIAKAAAIQQYVYNKKKTNLWLAVCYQDKVVNNKEGKESVFKAVAIATQ
jgi:hypothetical protein